MNYLQQPQPPGDAVPETITLPDGSEKVLWFDAKGEPAKLGQPVTTADRQAWLGKLRLSGRFIEQACRFEPGGDGCVARFQLAPFVATTSLRDTMLWETPEGVTAQWTAMGEGCTDLPAYFDLFEKRCPGVTVHIETISGFAKPFACWSREFWRAYPEARAEDFAGFLALARQGRPIDPYRPLAAGDAAEAERRYQLDELARSIRHCRNVLGLGTRA